MADLLSSPALPEEFREELQGINGDAPRKLIDESERVALGLAQAGILARSCPLLSAMPTLVLFQWLDLGINFRLTLREEGAATVYQLTKFDRTRPAADLAPPTVTTFKDQRDALPVLASALQSALGISG